MDQLEALFEKHGVKKRVTQPDQSVINAIEQLCCFTLPADYRYFLLNYEGFETEFGKEYLRLWDISQVIEYNKDYEITAELPFTLGIGGNGGGAL